MHRSNGDTSASWPLAILRKGVLTFTRCTFLRLLVAGVSGPGRHKTPKTVAQTVAQTVATRQPLLQAADALLERSLAALPIARAVGEVAVAAVATEDAVLAAV